MYVYFFQMLKNKSVEGLALFLFVIGYFHWSVHNYGLKKYESSSYLLRASYPDKHTAVAIEQF